MSVVTSRQARTGRIQELGLLSVAYLISLVAWILVYYGVSNSLPEFWLPPNFWVVAGVAAVFLLGAHLIIRKLAPYADPVFFPAAVLLTGLGLAMIHRIDYALVERGEGAELKGQLALAIVGIVLMVATVALLRDHRILRRYTYLSAIAGIILLLMPMLPVIGRTINGARLWIVVAGFSYQPAELAKIFLTIFFAGYLVVHRDNLSLSGPKVLGLQLPRLKHLAPLIIAWLAGMAILALERDFGTAILFFGLFVAMLYVATERLSWIIIGALMSAAGVWAIVQMMPHIQARFTVWLHAMDPEVYDAPYGSYQLVQGWFGMASGGLFGTGFGQGSPANSYASNSDFIIASFGEELGLVGVLGILSIYLIIVGRAMKTGIDLRDGFGKLLASGFGFTIALQSFVVVGGITRVIPLTGLAMPFLALGGSALLTNWIIIGMLIRMSDAARRPFTPASTPLSAIRTGELPGIKSRSRKKKKDADDAEAASKPDDTTSAHTQADATPSADSPDDQDRNPTEVVRL
ncbi:MAG: FtsW/RodA/SpoVE family cell cycle protein [Actinomycetaceae bacterium]|nr:FtsW/RodA/SpoVE family cell cycle protein [Actinomycetaceae bacterium]